MRLLITTFVLLSLLACSSAPEIKLYRLSATLQQPYTKIKKSQLDKPIIQLLPVKLAQYLATRNLIYQINNYQINSANNHLWAEDLDIAIEKSLLNKMQSLNHLFFMVRDENFLKQKIQYKVQVTFDAFHASDQAKVISSGHYAVFDGLDQLLILNNFSYHLPQKHDGYLDSVKQLDNSLNRLAVDIVNFIKNK